MFSVYRFILVPAANQDVTVILLNENEFRSLEKWSFDRCSALLSSRSSPVPLRLGGTLPHPLTASVLMLFFVEQTNPDSGHRLCHLTFLQFEDLCSTADNEVTNFFQKCLHSRTTYYVHFFHHNPPHHNDTASDGVHTPFSYLPSF